MTKLLALAQRNGVQLFCPGFPGAQATQVLTHLFTTCSCVTKELFVDAHADGCPGCVQHLRYLGVLF